MDNPIRFIDPDGMESGPTASTTGYGTETDGQRAANETNSEWAARTSIAGPAAATAFGSAAIGVLRFINKLALTISANAAAWSSTCGTFERSNYYL